MEENAESQSVTTRSVGIKYGTYSGLASVAFFLILALMGLNTFGNLSYIGLAISIVLMVLAQKNFKDSGDGYMSYGQGMGVVFWYTLVSLTIGMAVRFLYISFYDESPLTIMLDEQVAKMQLAGTPDEQIEMATTWTKKLFWPIGICFGFIGGIVIGLIVTIFTQKKNQQADMM